ncbi:50S ribosomal protein L25 [Serratia symbiotica str. 'Cinara cedri']|nr:50S ribosomal protein L25 [Serratia symbiotica str. 'Cinara cedri']
MFILNAQVRKEQGKGASRRLRVLNKFPAVIYGGKDSSISIEIVQDSIKNIEVKPEFYSENIILVINGQKKLSLRYKLYSVISSNQNLLTLTLFVYN